MLERLQALERGIAGETYNIGGRSELTNIDVVRAICDILDRLEPSKNFARLISFVPDRPGHDRRYAIDPSKIEHKGDDLVWNPDDRPDKPLETSTWVVKDVGSGYRFSAHLVAENHVLDVQIPHPLDLKSIPRRYY